MLERPDIQDEKVLSSLKAEYGLHVRELEFLPLGADVNTAVFRVSVGDHTQYFLKLRRGAFDEISVELPRSLNDQGIAEVIAPLKTQKGQLWSSLDEYKVILYPFIDGQNGYTVSLSDQQWAIFGEALKAVHTARIPGDLLKRIQPERFSSTWRQITRVFLDRVGERVIDDPIAIKTDALLKAKSAQILDLVNRAENYAQALKARPLDMVLCHSDVHAGNILVGRTGDFYIVDWDNPILAPKERDLMFIGGGQGFLGHTPQEEEALFYRGYGPAQIDPLALAYYRFERIVQDIASFCEQLLLTSEGGEDREQSFKYLASNFLPNNTIEIAYQSEMRAL